jgi:WD40 repeat protein
MRHEDSIYELTFSPEGKTLAADLHVPQVIHYDATGKPSQVPAEPGSGPPRVVLYNVATGKELATFRKPADQSMHLSFDRKSRLLGLQVPQDEEAVYLWDLAAGKKSCLLRLPDKEKSHTHSSPILLPDGKTLAVLRFPRPKSEGPPEVVLWDLAGGKPLRRFRPPGERSIGAIVCSNDGKTLATDDSAPPKDRTSAVRLWDLATGTELRQLDGNLGRVTALAFTPDDKVLITASRDKPVRLWDVASGKELRQLDVAADIGEIQTLTVSPDGKLLAAAGHQSPFQTAIRVIDLAKGQEVSPWAAHRAAVQSVAFSPDGRLLATAGDDHDVRLWEAATGRPLRQLRGHRSPVLAVAFAPDGGALAAVEDGCRGSYDYHPCEVRLWNPRSGRLLHRWQGWKGPPSLCSLALAFSPDGRRLADGGSGRYDSKRGWLAEVALYDPATGRKERTLKPGDGRVIAHALAVAFSPDGKLLASGGDNLKVLLWDPDTGEIRRTLELPPQKKSPAGDEPFPPPGHATTLAFTPDGRTLAGMEEHRTLYFWEVATGKIRYSKPLPHHGFGDDAKTRQNMVLSPDGRLLATADKGGRVCVWDLAGLRLLRHFDGHRNRVYSLAFSPDGRRLASASSDTTVLVWDVSELATRRRPPGKPLTAADLEALWRDLASGDAARAYQAILRLADDPAHSVPFLAQRLRPVPQVTADRIARLVAELDDARFAVRERAARELSGLGDVAEPALQRVLRGQPSAEVARQARDLLGKLRGPAWLREQRALEAVEHAGTPEARQLLEKLAQGEPQAELTRQARVAAQRLAR